MTSSRNAACTPSAPKTPGSANAAAIAVTASKAGPTTARARGSAIVRKRASIRGTISLTRISTDAAGIVSSGAGRFGPQSMRPWNTTIAGATRSGIRLSRLRGTSPCVRAPSPSSRYATG